MCCTDLWAPPHACIAIAPSNLPVIAHPHFPKPGGPLKKLLGIANFTYHTTIKHYNLIKVQDSTWPMRNSNNGAVPELLANNCLHEVVRGPVHTCQQSAQLESVVPGPGATYLLVTSSSSTILALRRMATAKQNSWR